MKKISLTLCAIFAISPFSYAQWATNNNNIYNSNTGNVGIGTVTPSTTLTGTNLTINTGGQFSSLILQNANTDQGFFTATNTQAILGTMRPGTTLQFNTAGLGRMLVDPTGNVGIGTTTPLTKLHIYQSAPDANGLIIQGNTINNDAAQHYIALTLDGDYGNGGGNYSQIRSYSNLYSGWGTQLAFFTTQYGVANTLKEQMRIDANGRVGIGTASPNAVLHINNNVPYADNPANQLILTNGGYRSSESGGLPVDNAGLAYYFTNYNAGGKTYDRTLDIKVRGASDGTYGAGMIRFFANNYAAGSAEREIMRIHGNGNVLIGKTIQTNPAYMLEVEGAIRSKQVVVNISGADFVFEPAYRLNPLSDVKKYIDQNHHLPEIPSAAQMKKDGLNVGDNQIKLLQKIEELTLYMIEKDKQIADLKQNQTSEKEQLALLKTQIEQMNKRLGSKK